MSPRRCSIVSGVCLARGCNERFVAFFISRLAFRACQQECRASFFLFRCLRIPRYCCRPDPSCRRVCFCLFFFVPKYDLSLFFILFFFFSCARLCCRPCPPPLCALLVLCRLIFSVQCEGVEQRVRQVLLPPEVRRWSFSSFLRDMLYIDGPSLGFEAFGTE